MDDHPLYPGSLVPDLPSLFVYEQRGNVRPYRKTAMDNILKRLGSRIGTDFSNHDLRRTCGRMMYRAGVRIEQIARIFGHADTRTTIHYLGLDYDDMSDAMSLYAQYQKAPIVPKMVQNGFSQMNGGPIGI
ncbi:MAG: site-specific integrase [Methanomassiliicoccales archaeon]|nr:site-specific integrase [Methanomassiliicoccales archaeon]